MIRRFRAARNRVPWPSRLCSVSRGWPGNRDGDTDDVLDRREQPVGVVVSGDGAGGAQRGDRRLGHARHLPYAEPRQWIPDRAAQLLHGFPIGQPAHVRPKAQLPRYVDPQQQEVDRVAQRERRRDPVGGPIGPATWPAWSRSPHKAPPRCAARSR